MGDRCRWRICITCLASPPLIPKQPSGKDRRFAGPSPHERIVSVVSFVNPLSLGTARNGGSTEWRHSQTPCRPSSILAGYRLPMLRKSPTLSSAPKIATTSTISRIRYRRLQLVTGAFTNLGGLSSLSPSSVGAHQSLSTDSSTFFEAQSHLTSFSSIRCFPRLRPGWPTSAAPGHRWRSAAAVQSDRPFSSPFVLPGSLSFLSLPKFHGSIRASVARTHRIRSFS
jgi:hypothetical protein